MALEGETPDLPLGNDSASGPVIEHDAQESVGGAVRAAFDLAKETAEAAGDPEKLEAIRVKRGAGGRFERGEGKDTRSATGEPTAPPKPAKAATGETPAPDAAEKSVAPQETVEKPTGDAPLVMKPPPGWNAQARADFARLPMHVQQAVAQREIEISKGFEQYAGLGEHMPRIKESGTTVAGFVGNAIRWNDSIKSNPVHTIMEAAKLGNVNMLALAHTMLQQAGYKIERPQGGAPQTQNPQPRQQPQAPDVSSLVQLEFTKREQAQAHQKATSEAEAFLADPQNVHAEAVLDDMVALIKAEQARGKQLPLKDAYERAIWAHPDIRPLLIKQQAPPPSNGNRGLAVIQARAAAKATVGAPSGNAPASKSPGNPKTVRDAVRAAYAAAQDAD